MSMKLRALLLDNFRAKVEQAYMHTGEAITLKSVPCEMEFEVSSGWMEHESEKHNYLPLFHLMGNIKEIHGNFPYNVSSLTFAKSDVETKLQKEILYYMKPEELAHLIQVGKFYTDKFQLPEILTRNTYSFPVLVDLTIVPPPNPAAYEQASFSVGLGEGGQIDRDNLPIFYIGFAGTGVNRKKDPLLDYYGIDFDNDFDMYVLTAESSGYTSPTLMEYVTEPQEEVQEEVENVEELYVTPEEEAAMLKQQRDMSKEDVPQLNPQDDYQMDDEDILLAQANKNIEKRIERVRSSKKSSTLQQQAQARQSERQDAKTKTASSTLEKLAKLESLVKGQNNRSDLMKKPESQPVQVPEESVVASSDVQHESATQSSGKVLEQPDMLQQQVDCNMDFDKESNLLVHPEDNPKEKENTTDVGGLDADEDDMTKLRDAQGADVSDTRLQAKVDEANVKENARQTAVDIQSDIAEGTSDGVAAGDADGEKKVGRDVSSVLNDVADAAEAQNGYDELLGVSY